ncbi:MAG: DUF2975 domain-containing protein [Eubacterium sp.]|nr:DUF2975 domain-containing protein [Eubacterium sp.]
METKMNKNINIIGKVGRILTTILAVFMILAAIATAVGIGVSATLPKDALSVEVTGTADVTAKGDILESLADAVIDSAKGGKGYIKIGDSNVVVGDVEDSVPDGVTAQKTDKGLALSVDNKRLNVNVNAIITTLVFVLLNTICTIVVLFMIRALMKSIEICETPFCDSVIKNMKRFGFSMIPLAFFSGTSQNSLESLFTVGVSVHTGIDFKVVFGILIIFMLAMIFSYGAELQRQSDETL